MENQNNLRAQLKQQLKDVYNRIKLEPQEIDNNKDRYLDRIAHVCSATFIAENADESVIRMLAKNAAPQLMEISKKGTLTEPELDDIVHWLNQTARKLVGAEPKPQPTAVKEDAGTPFEKQEIIPVGFEPTSPKVSTEAFFSFPLSSKTTPDENNLYEQHLRYLKEILEQGGISNEEFEKITQVMNSLPKYRYKKYFDVYPGGIFEEATLSMLYIKLKNKSLERLKI